MFTSLVPSFISTSIERNEPVWTLYTVLPIVLVIGIALILITTSCCIYRHRHRRLEEEHIYDHVIYASPPPLPPERIQCQNNLAYVKVKLTDCIAYGSGLKLPDNPSPPDHPTTHKDELERDVAESVINQLQHHVEDTPLFITPV